MEAAKPPPKRVLVLGAGWAGLSAARALLDGAPPGAVEVTVIEATDQVGGRARAAVLPGSGLVELGATWFHGTKGNPVYDFAASKGVVPPPPPAPTTTRQQTAAGGGGGEGGGPAAPAVAALVAARADRWGVELVRPGAAAPLAGAERAAAVAAMSEYGEALEDLGSDEEGEDPGPGGSGGAAPPRTFGDALRARFDKAVARQAGPEAAAAFAEGWACRERLQRAYDGFHASDDAAAAFAQEYCDLEGENVPVPGGYQHLAELLAEGLPIRLGCPVSRVDWRGPSPAVVLESGEALAADAVVVTFSLGVLKAAVAASDAAASDGAASDGAAAASDGAAAAASDGAAAAAASDAAAPGGAAAGAGDAPPAEPSLVFDPPLPPSKADPIRKLRIGLVNKVFFELDGEGPEQESPAAGSNPSGSAPAPGAGGKAEGAHEAFTPQPPPLAYSSRPHPAAVSTASGGAGGGGGGGGGAAEEGLIGPRRRLQPGGLAAMTTPAEGSGGADGEPGATAAGAGAAAAAAGPVLTSYCFLWPSRRELWGVGGTTAAAAAGGGGADGGLLPLRAGWPADLPAWDPVFAGPPAPGVPAGCEWVYGLHSWRYSDGPEWIKPPAAAAADGLQPAAASAADEEEEEEEKEAGSALSAAARAAPGGFRPRAPFWRRAWSRPAPGRRGRAAVLWVTGRAALAAESMSAAELAAGAAALLGAFPAVPRPAGAPGAPALRAHRSGWCQDRFFLGSYSYPGPDADGGAVDALAAPLACGGAAGGAGGAGGGGAAGGLLCFAGEATCRAHQGTVHGAFLSGRREAARLLRAWGLGEGPMRLGPK
ncbi:hypothetical protein Rsub_02237 [Raphidocelis subcapitata]|uniref:Amine oxidase domain-containing protein n=1 Tax=Raphidocelis subcapitata TaxID=307507 RepID=A0A2V0NQ05_9CHLO|nr:hypothetical protein Rsub_02237 [Raphidocelis subcapitata]|eukprot:GBF89359.1 hypothetical protein Rsub_02237 [Raphidocelis subcapitata]